ncbi:MAG: OsmC family protein [Gemmatimonadaceae bacterium]
MTAPAPSSVRDYTVAGRSTEIFGRVLCSVRNHHFIVDGPVQNGCPGEAVTPPEIFLASIAACGVELAQVIAKEDGIGVTSVAASVYGMVDRGNPVRADVTVFNEVRMTFSIAGATPEEAGAIVQKFKKR